MARILSAQCHAGNHHRQSFGISNNEGLTLQLTRFNIWSVDDKKRQGIFDAAVKAFSTLGFKKTSISDIAKHAGVAKGTIYLACDSKEDLFYQVVMQDLRKWIATVAALIDPREPADQTLLRLSHRSLEFFDRFPLVRDLLIGHYHGEHPAWADKFEGLRTLGRAHVAEILRVGVRQGRFRDDLQIEQTAQILQDFQLTALILNRRGSLSRPDMKERVEAGFDLIFKGLRSSGAA